MANIKVNNNITPSMIHNRDDGIDTESLEKIAWKIPNNNSIFIDFNTMFGRDDLSTPSTFIINRRSFYKEVKKIAYDINYILNMEPKLIISYLNVITTIQNLDEKDEDKIRVFKSQLKNIFLDKRLNQIVSDYIDNTYTISLDAETGRRINIELQLTDRNNKILLKTAMMVRFLIPLLCLFKYDKNDSCFSYCTSNILKNLAQSNNIINKLYKIIDSRVQATKMSDRMIWDYLKNAGVDTILLTNTIRKSLLRQIIPKLEPNSSAIKFFDVVIRYKITYTFKYNFPISFKPIKTNEASDIDDKEKMEMRNFIQHHSESDYIINDISIKQIISKILNKYSKEFIEKEVEKLPEKINAVQEYFLEIFYYSKFKLITGEYEKKILLINMIMYLNEYGIETIPLLLRNNLVTSNQIKNITIKKKLSHILNRTNSYKLVLERYHFFSGTLAKNNFIAQMNSISDFIFTDIDTNEKLEINKDKFLVDCMVFTLMLNEF